jgi:alkylation response protein AidB-like acyl-CoA dehydrogenase
MLAHSLWKGAAVSARRVVVGAPVRTLAYKAPTRDMSFVMKELLDCEKHYAEIGYENADWDTIDAIMSECAKFSENVLEPLNVLGDTEGARLVPGAGMKRDANGRKLDGNTVVTTPGFKEAYDEWSAAGWSSLSVPEAYGGQGLPVSVGILRSEMVGTAAWALGMYSGLSMGCMNTLILHGSESMKETYLPQLASGEWLGTMCLTEPQCGTDLAQVATTAVPQDDGTYRLTGTKIWISSGDHDLGTNIVHIVLARVPGAPAGTKGISLFLVPKHIIQEDGSLEESINVECARLEKKMGINASATAEMSFEDSVGYLIGKENDGLRQMFAFMCVTFCESGCFVLFVCLFFPPPLFVRTRIRLFFFGFFVFLFFFLLFSFLFLLPYFLLHDRLSIVHNLVTDILI